MKTDGTLPSNSLSEPLEEDLEKVGDLGLGDRSPGPTRSARFASLSATRISRLVGTLALIYLTIISVGRTFQLREPPVG